jgi:hypothetical protein
MLFVAYFIHISLNLQKNTKKEVIPLVQYISESYFRASENHQRF